MSNVIELEKCGKEGCNVSVVKRGCCGNVEVDVKCNKCPLKLEGISALSVEELWSHEIKQYKEAKNDN